MATKTWIVYLVDSEERTSEPIWIVASVTSEGQWIEHTVSSVNVHKNPLERRACNPNKLDDNFGLRYGAAPQETTLIDDSPFYQRVILQLN